ncbi:MAG: SDR family oxidoreductase [Pseudomonadales bacterium]|jgi:uncharacterized protein YbjT (DUF2867 family)|nr:SDR family oxidoreductase [Pseudomonadales bacterium]
MPKAVVLGAYGLIGSACCRALQAAGFSVTAVGRSKAAASRSLPDVDWIFLDLAATSPETWTPLLAGADVVVNAAGALQDGARDSLRGIHEAAVASLVAGLGGASCRLVQISAAGVSADAPTEFLRSKARGDASVMASGLDWVILRPTLVLGSQAYGGTALLRASAAVPLVQLCVFADAPVQTVWVGDVARAVVDAAQRRIPAGTVADLTEPASRTLAETQVRLRSWLGFPPWRYALTVPRALTQLLGRAADALGWLGWRAPLRSTALRTLERGITGEAEPWVLAGGRRCRSLEETLAILPATAQERLFARAFLLLPLAVATLALFWIVSGCIGLLRYDASLAVLLERGVPRMPAAAAVGIGGLLDVALGAGVLYRPLARSACLGMVALSAVYVLAAAALTPDLWLDPLGPMLKVLPGMVLALVTAALLEPR